MFWKVLAALTFYSAIVATTPAVSAPTAETAPACDPLSYCCKVCRKGKACGNTCIARDRNCTQPPGCACDE